MSRALATFAVFCALLVVLGAAVGWWLGWPLVQLAFDPERRAAPYHLLYFDDAGPGDPTGYGPALEAQLKGAGGTRLWQARELSVPVGQMTDEWQRVQAFRAETGAGFVRLVTGRGYRALAARAPKGRRSVLGLKVAPAASQLAPQLLMIGARFPDQAGADSGQALAAAFQEALALGGRLYWDSPVAVLEGDAAISHLIVLGFDAAPALDEWLFSADMNTQLALLGTRFSNLKLWRVSAVSR